MRRIVSLLIVFGLCFLVVACGGSGNSSSSSNQPTPNQPAPTASSTPPPSSGGTSGGTGGSSSGSGTSGGSTSGGGASGGSGGSGGGTSGGGAQQAPTSYIEALVPMSANGSGGNAEVNPNGIGNQPALGQYALTLAGGTPNSNTYVARFCPFGGGNCMTLTDKPTFRNSGGMQIAGTFPGHGAFSGAFIISQNSVDTWETGFTAPSSGSVVFTGTQFSAQLVRASTISNGLGSQAQFGVGSDPLASGAATVTEPDKMVHPNLTGASPSTTYTVSYCDPAGTKCVALGTLTTDSSGSGSTGLSITPARSPGDLNAGQFKLSRDGANGPIEFVSAFIIP